MRAPSKQGMRKISRRRRDWDASSKEDSAPSSADGSASQLADWRRRTSFLVTIIIVRYQSGRNPRKTKVVILRRALARRRTPKVSVSAGPFRVFQDLSLWAAAAGSRPSPPETLRNDHCPENV